MIEAGLKTYKNKKNVPLTNYASLERIEVIDLAKKYKAKVIITATGKKGMPKDTSERISNAISIV